MHRVKDTHALRRLQTPVQDNGALTQGNAPTAMREIQPPQVERGDAREADYGQEKNDICAEAAGVRRCLSGCEEEGPNDVSR